MTSREVSESSSHVRCNDTSSFLAQLCVQGKVWEHKKGGEQTKKERPQKCIRSASRGVGVSQQAGRAVGSRGAPQSSIELTIIKDGPGKHSSVLRSILSDYWWEILIKNNNNNNNPKKEQPPTTRELIQKRN